MNFCPYCNAQIKDHWLFCHFCNKPLIADVENQDKPSEALNLNLKHIQDDQSYVYPNFQENINATNLNDVNYNEKIDQELVIMEELISQADLSGESYGDLLLKKAGLYYQKRDFNSSLKVLEIALENFTRDNDLLNVAISRNEMGLIQEELGYFDNAIYHFERAIEILVELNDIQKLLQVYNNLANIYFILKDLEKSYEYYQKAITLAKQEELFLEEIQTSSNLVEVLFSLKNYERVKDILRQNTVFFKQVGDNSGMISTLTKYGKLYYYLGEDHYSKSKNNFEHSLELINQISDKLPFHVKAQMEWECFLYLGIHEMYLKHHDKAEDLLLKSLEGIRVFEIGDSINQGIVLKNLGRLYNDNDEYQRAIEYYTLSGEIYYKFGEDITCAELKSRIAQIHLEYLNDAMEAIKFFEEALEIYENKTFEKQSAEILHKLGDIYINREVFDLAMSNFERAKFYYQEINDEYNTNLLTEKIKSLINSNESNL
jgi:tetratricopeptide (TPR) repeat protein